MKVAGILKTNRKGILTKDMYPIISNTLNNIITVPFETIQSNDDVEKILSSLKLEAIDHSRYRNNKSKPKQEDLNSPLVKEIWKHIQFWVNTHLDSKIGNPCSIYVKENLEDDAAGLFWYGGSKKGDECFIEIDKNILSNTPYFLVVLVHEYMHYVHYCLVTEEVYYNCPLIFKEGFAEHCSRLFHSQSFYDLPDDLKKSWNEYYELGRLIVNQICNEGFGISGFVRGFLRYTKKDHTWSTLDSLFL